MTTFPLTVISPSVAPSHGTSSPDSVTTRSSPEVISSTPCLALSTARSAGERAACSGSGSHTVMNGAVSVSPYTCVMSQPNSPSSRSMVAAAGGAPAVITRTPAGTSPRAPAGGRVGQRDQHRGRGAQPAHPFAGDQREDLRGLNLAQADVRAARGGHRPGERPPVGVEHRQRPQVTVADAEAQVQQGADGVHRGVPVRDHHALGPRRGAAGVVDRQQVPLADLRPGERRPRVADQRLVVQPAGTRALERDEVPHAGHLVADRVDRVQVVAVHAEHRGTRVVDHVDEVFRGEPVVHRHEHRAELRHRVERLELRVRVRRDRGDPVALADAERLQGARPAVAAVEELLVGEPEVAVDDGLARAVQAAGAAGELKRGQRRFHGTHPASRAWSLNSGARPSSRTGAAYSSPTASSPTASSLTALRCAVGERLS